jgi:hypothetical protein
MGQRGKWKRFALRAAFWASAVACVALGLVWFLSRWYAAQGCYGTPSSEVYFQVRHGRVSIIAGSQGAMGMGVSMGLGAEVGRDPEPGWDWAPRIRTRGGRVPGVLFVMPLVIPLAVSAAALLGTIYAGRRPKAGACPSCGYDLSATPPSSPCPECGHMPPSLSAPKEKAEEAGASSA